MTTSNILDGLRPLAVPIDSIRQMEGNPRRGQVEAVAGSLKRFGQHKPIVVQRSTGEILIGNHTHRAALSLGWTEIAVLFTDDTREEAVARSLADNHTHDLGGYDNAEAAALMAELAETDRTLLDSAGYADDEVDAMLKLANADALLADVDHNFGPTALPEALKPPKATETHEAPPEPPADEVKVEKVTARERQREALSAAPTAVSDFGEHLFVGDALDALAEMPDATFNAVITDPLGGVVPKGQRTDDTGFGDFEWHGVPGVEFWQEIHRVVRPGAYVAVMASTKSWHRVAVAAEDAGLELRDTLMWLYGTGMTDGLDIGQATSRKTGGGNDPYFRQIASMTDAQREEFRASRDNEWDGWSTSLKPAWKPILLLRRPPKMAAADAALRHGTAVLNIDATRIGDEERDAIATFRREQGAGTHGGALSKERVVVGKTTLGRWPANVVVDEEVQVDLGDTGRYFLCAPASKQERNAGGADNDHPMVRPVALTEWLIRLVCPAGGVVLDPFCGSGTTGVAAVRCGVGFVGVDRSEHYVNDIAAKRIAAAKV